MSLAWLYGVQAALVLWGGVVTSRSDWMSGKIKNKHVGLLGCAGAVLGLVDALVRGLVVWWVAAVVLGIAVPLGMWIKGWIPAGDAKLLMAFSVALPAWWYPEFAPRVYPFSLVLLLALGVLAIPVVGKALLGIVGVGGVSWPGQTFSVGMIQLTSFFASVCMSMAVLWVWRVWQWYGGSFSVEGGVVTGLALILVGLASGVVVLGSVPVWVSIPGVVGFGVLFLKWGGSVVWMVVLMVSAAVMVWVQAVLLPMVSEVSARKVSVEDLHGGEVLQGCEDPEGISQQGLEGIKAKDSTVWVCDEVQVAHMVFAVILVVGAVKGAGWIWTL